MQSKDYKDLLDEFNKNQKRINKRQAKKTDVSEEVSETLEPVKPTSSDNKAFQEKRSRSFCITTYIERNALERFLKSSQWLRHWAYCEHDKDTDEKGNPKTSHIHVILYTYNSKTSSAVKKLFDRYSAQIYYGTGIEPQNTLVKSI